MLTIAQEYESGQVNGWLGEERAKAEFEYWKDRANFVQFKLGGQTKATAGKKVMLYEVPRKLFGHDLDNSVAQQIGDCVSWGAKHATEYLSSCDILMRGDREKYRPVFSPYYYGTGRCFIGGQHDYQDGSTGSWMAAAVMKYGTLFSDESGVPQYAGKVAKEWGAKGPPDNFVEVAKHYLVKSAAQINGWEDFVAAITNGYPVPTASSIGYNMEASSDGFHRQTTTWNHQMCFIGVDDRENDPYAILLNSWADAHGHLKDFDTGEALPIGVLRVRKADVLKHIRQGETYAYSQFDGFPEQDIDEKLFKLGGN